MAHKAYIHEENGKLVTSKRNHKPPKMVCECPKDENGNYIVDLDVIDVYTCEKTGTKKSKVNDVKKARKEHKIQEAKKEAEKRAQEAQKKQVELKKYSVQDAIEARSFDDLKGILAAILRAQGADEERK